MRFVKALPYPMYAYIHGKNFIKTGKLFTAIGVIFCASACVQKSNNINKAKLRELQVADSNIIAGNEAQGMKMLSRLRQKINPDDPLLGVYYCHQSMLGGPADRVNAYADSAMAFFTESRISKYPAEYAQALVAKGNADVTSKKYVSALDLLYRAEKVLAKTDECNNGQVSVRIGFIYYLQKNYRSAAQYWGQSYRKINLCGGDYTPQKRFLEMQSALNNTGLAFFKAGMLDSARYYYLADNALIDHAQKTKLVEPHSINASRAVVYDNLGGLYFKLGELDTAENYLVKALAIPNADVDGLHIPPNIKLAEIYLKTNKPDKAKIAFDKSKALLDKYASDNRDSEQKWYDLYAQYLSRLNKPSEAYLAENRYINLKDSADQSSTDLYRLDIGRELYNISQRQSLSEMHQKSELTKLYLLGIGTSMLLAFIIMLLINRNLSRTKRSHAEANLRNDQLQLTLNELERVNKNYIRIMRVMAHDIINPLSGMTGIASMLMLADISEDNRHMLQLIESTGLNSMDMIKELLKSGLSSDDEQMETQVMDLRSLLFDSIELLQFKANDKDQQIILDFDETPVMANINQEKMWRVFNNLIVNSIKFSHDGATIRVGIKQRPNSILISVADSGVGIPDKDKDSVFEMFTSAKKAGTNGEQPFGLGLSISKKIVEMHGGKIWFESEAGFGTTFYVELPV